MSLASDKRGRQLVGGPTGNSDEVYDPSGHLVWQTPRGTDEQFVGGYTAQRQKSAGKYSEVIRTTSGRMITRLPEPKDDTNPEVDSAEPQLQAVRPGLLAAIGLGTSGSRAALIDVSRPGHARLRPLHPPPIPSNRGPISPQEKAAGISPQEMAVGAHLAWHTSLPVLPTSDISYGVVASTGGEEALAVEDAESQRVWFLRPDTGALIGPKQGRDGQLQPPTPAWWADGPTSPEAPGRR